MILGRAEFLSASVEDRRRRLARQNRIRIEPYEWLITQAEERAKPARSSNDLFEFILGGRTQDSDPTRVIKAVFGGFYGPTAFVSAIRTVSYEFVTFDDSLEYGDDQYQEILYKEVLADQGPHPSAHLETGDWSDWLSAPEMEFDHTLTLLVTEMEPSPALQDSLTHLGSGLWVGMDANFGSVLGANFLLFFSA